MNSCSTSLERGHWVEVSRSCVSYLWPSLIQLLLFTKFRDIRLDPCLRCLIFLFAISPHLICQPPDCIHLLPPALFFFSLSLSYHTVSSIRFIFFIIFLYRPSTPNMPAPLLKQISLWKHQEQNATHPMSYKFLQDEESSSEKGSEQTLNNDDIRPSPRPRERIVFGILVFIIIILSGLLIDSHRRIQASPPPKPKSPVPDCTSQYRRELPQIRPSNKKWLILTSAVPLKPVLFDFSPTYESGPDSDALWDAVIPAGGLIAIKHPEQYNLKKGLPTIIPDAQIFGVSVTHQFHCLVGNSSLSLSLNLNLPFFCH